jgi:hypothetical protein
MVGAAFQFDGIGGRVDTPAPSLTNIFNNFTIEFWALPNLTRANTAEGNSGISGTCCQRYAIAPENGGFANGAVGAGVSVGLNRISVFEHGNGYLPSTLVYDANISDWTHVALVYQDRRPSLFVNGTLVRTGVVSARPYVFPSKQFGDVGGHGYYSGQLDEVSI